MKKHVLSLSLTLFTLLLLGTAQAQVKSQLVEYKDGQTTLEGYLAYDASVKGKRPAVIVVHEWTGLNDYTKKRCDQLARMGYVAFAADIYGKGIRPGNPQDAGKEAGKYKGNIPLLRQRINTALEYVRKNANVNPAKVAAIGYCFGGTTVLELARSGANVSGVVSFHGNLASQTPADAKNITSKILVCHGAMDPFAPKADVDAFMQEMNDAKVDYQLNLYSNAVHSFTNPEAGNDPSKGAAYNKEADMRSWEAMKLFFAEIFQ